MNFVCVIFSPPPGSISGVGLRGRRTAARGVEKRCEEADRRINMCLHSAERKSRTNQRRIKPWPQITANPESLSQLSARRFNQFRPDYRNRRAANGVRSHFRINKRNRSEGKLTISCKRLKTSTKWGSGCESSKRRTMQLKGAASKKNCLQCVPQSTKLKVYWIRNVSRR